jgi:hypothetical protein
MKRLLKLSNGLEITLFYSEISDECQISTIYLTEKLLFCGIDYFEALIKMRLHFENKDLFLLCNGSRRDVYPSGMSRDMSQGLKAYIHKIGFPCLRDDLVDIFEAADLNQIGFVYEQKEFRNLWIESLGN